jgi:hypothetical protein
MATTAAARATPPLPVPIHAALGRINRRLKLAVGLRGVGIALLAGSALMLVAMGADLLWTLPRGVRLGLRGFWVVTLTALVASMFRSLSRRASLVGLAALAERADPTLGERLTGAVGLLGPDAQGAPGLIAASARDASQRAGAVDPTRAVPVTVPRRWAAAGLVGALAIVVLVSIRPVPFAVLARRFLLPSSPIDRVGRFEVAVAPGDTVVGLGTDLNVLAEVSPRFGSAGVPAAAWLEWTEAATGQSRRLTMEVLPERSGRRAFRATIPQVTTPLTYKVVAGRTGEGESRRFNLRAVPPPAVSRLTVWIDAPAYVNRPTLEVVDPARIDAWEGGTVRQGCPARPGGGDRAVALRRDPRHDQRLGKAGLGQRSGGGFRRHRLRACGC